MIPHGHCYLWQTNLVALHVVSDALTALAYFSIPLSLVFLVRRRDDLPFNWILLLFSAFILACGTAHVMEIWTLWHPNYWTSGVIKATMALVSVAAAATLLPIIQQVLKLPRLMSIATMNQQLQHELAERHKAEQRLSEAQAALEAANQTLEERIQERIQAIAKTNQQLRQEIARRRQTEALFEAFMDNSFAVTFIKDAAGRYLYVNPQFEQLADHSQAEMLGKTDKDWLPLDIAWEVRQHDADVLHTGQATQLLETVPARDGTPNYWMVCKFPCPTADGRTALGGIAVNVTEQKRIERELFKEKELAQITLQSIGDAVITTDAWGKVTYLNPVAERLTAWPVAEAEGVPLSEVFHIINEFTRERVENPAEQALRTGQVVGLANHTVLIAKDGNEFSIADSAAPIVEKDGTIIGVVLVFHDVTESCTLSQQLAWQASHDELTGLKNRRYFELRLSEALKSPHREHILCFLDLDQFKIVNDTCGHAAGDELLNQIGGILNQNVRSADIVARLGGDEFGILLSKCPPDNARRVMELIRQAIQDFRFAWEDKTFSVGVSIGVVEMDDSIQNLSDALGAADAACYAAKDKGRNRLYLYHADDKQLSEQRTQQQWITRLQQALDEDRFQLYQQPIAASTFTQGSELHHHEILLRLVDNEGKIVPPMAFIPAAERYGLMPLIDRWVIQAFFSQADGLLCNTTLSLSPTDIKTGFYTINLSGASINDEQFLPFLKQQIEQATFSPESLCFEITETVAVSNLNKARKFISEIKALGCSFALDDFGSGMSSFGYLQHLAVDYVKIDGSFVRNLLTDKISVSIVEAITSIAHSMGLGTIAERVEDVETQQVLQSLGIDYVQGYGIGRPKPLVQKNSVPNARPELASA